MKIPGGTAGKTASPAQKLENFRVKMRFFRRKFGHSNLDSREQQAIPPDLFDQAGSIAIAGTTVR